MKVLALSYQSLPSRLVLAIALVSGGPQMNACEHYTLSDKVRKHFEKC